MFKHCVAKYKSGLTIYKKNKTIFRSRPIKKDKRYKILLVTKKVFFSSVENAICLRVLKEMKTKESIIGINKNCTIRYDKYTFSYTLLVPIVLEPKNFNSRIKICGIDPGIRTFLTVYSKDDCFNICESPKLNKYFEKIDRLNGKLNKNYDPRINCEYIKKYHTKFITPESKQTRKYKKAIGKVYDKIHNRMR